MRSPQPNNLNTFLIIWGGQLVSTLGSEMTSFAMTIWAWELTGKATPLSLIFFFSRLPRVIAATFAGLLVDRYNRKYLMIMGDTVAGVSTLVIFALLVTGNLVLWHFYLAIALSSFFGYFQTLSYSSSMSAIVPKQHYARATAMGSIQVFGANIFAPALASLLYYRVGFAGILILDLITFFLAIISLSIVKIPQPRLNPNENENRENLWQRLTMGCRYLFGYPGLIAILIFLLSTNLFGSASTALIATSILARSGNDSNVLASVQSAMGIGGLVGAALLSLWGGFRPRIYGLLSGVGLQNLGQIAFGLGRGQSTWTIAAFSAAFFAPWRGSFNQAIWLSKVKPDIQGRVFATRYLAAQITSPFGALIAGPLADRVFEPAMIRGGALAEIFGGIFGTGTGAGIAVEYTLFSGCGLSLALIGYALPILRNVEAIVPDYDLEEDRS